jgi:predicted RNA polymerase sigma factor
MSRAGARSELEAAYRTQARRVLATLIRLLGSFDAAEEARHDAFVAAAEHWPESGVPDNPYGARFGVAAHRTLCAAGGHRGSSRVNGYHLAHAARADMQRRLGLTDAARASYERALELTRQPAERRFLQARLARLA